MQAREYRPEVGRFLSQDRFEAAGADLALQSDPLTQNRYAFAGGNPVSNIEWDGHRPVANAQNGPVNSDGRSVGNGNGGNPEGESAPPEQTEPLPSSEQTAAPAPAEPTTGGGPTGDQAPTEQEKQIPVESRNYARDLIGVEVNNICEWDGGCSDEDRASATQLRYTIFLASAESGVEGAIAERESNADFTEDPHFSARHAEWAASLIPGEKVAMGVFRGLKVANTAFRGGKAATEGARAVEGGASAVAPKLGSRGGPGTGKRYIPEDVKRREVEASQGLCRFCKEPVEPTPGSPLSREFDHAWPYSRGGDTTFENIQSLCRTCNRTKGASTTEEFLNPTAALGG